MKLTTGILAVGLMTGGLWAQNANVINNVQSTMNGVQQQKKADSDAALGITNTPQAKPDAKSASTAPAKTAATKPATTAPASTTPAKASAAKPVPSAPAKTASAKPAPSAPAKTATTKPVPAVPAKTAAAKPASSVPAKVAEQKPAASATVKTVATKSTQSTTVNMVAANPSAAPAKNILAPVKSGAVAVKAAPAPAKPAAQAQAKVVIKKGTAPRTIIAAQETTPKPGLKKPSVPTKISAEAKPDEAVAPVAPKPEEKKPEEKKWAMSGKRDPFFSPVVQAPTGSGCSSGKKCLEIGQINLRGVVKSENGFIAVVTNSLNKAYFLRENDPVFNGYVMRITGDTVVFQETVQDKLGKPLTREVTKKIFTPAV